MILRFYLDSKLTGWDMSRGESAKWSAAATSGSSKPPSERKNKAVTRDSTSKKSRSGKSRSDKSRSTVSEKRRDEDRVRQGQDLVGVGSRFESAK